MVSVKIAEYLIGIMWHRSLELQREMERKNITGNPNEYSYLQPEVRGEHKRLDSV